MIETTLKRLDAEADAWVKGQHFGEPCSKITRLANEVLQLKNSSEACYYQGALQRIEQKLQSVLLRDYRDPLHNVMRVGTDLYALPKNRLSEILRQIDEATQLEAFYPLVDRTELVAFKARVQQAYSSTPQYNPHLAGNVVPLNKGGGAPAFNPNLGGNVAPVHKGPALSASTPHPHFDPRLISTVSPVAPKTRIEFRPHNGPYDPGYYKEYRQQSPGVDQLITLIKPGDPLWNTVCKQMQGQAFSKPL